MEFSNLLFALFIILVSAKVFGEIAQRLGQSPVIGELIAGVIIGGSVLNLIQPTDILHSLAEIGAILLLFQVGVSSNLYEFLKVGIWAFLVACVGVILPFLFGFLICLQFGYDMTHAIFIGAILTATSVGITARVFSDFKKTNTDEAKIVLGAAVIDDVIGLAILAVVMKLATTGTVSFLSISKISGLAILFLAGSIYLGVLLAPFLFKILKAMKSEGALIVGAFAFCLLLSYLAALAGLAPIIGAFSAGLILSINESKTHIEENIKPISDVFVPVFFVLMGALIDISIFNPFIPGNKTIILLAGVLFIAAVIGKALSGFVVIKKGINRLLIGVAMVPRGEVGLIFAGMGLTNHIINKSIYSAAVIVIILTTFITPFFLKLLFKEEK